MQDNETLPEKARNDKEKIRARYQGVDPSEIELIPALPPESIFEGTQEKRVAVYIRVSTDDPRQTSSFELQKNHYTDFVSRHEHWNLVEIFSDEGISGTSVKNRTGFITMIEQCKEGKIDLIITKTVARFARNLLDCIWHVRMLAALEPPVGVLFETDGIYTLDSSKEFLLSFIAMYAQEESRNKSDIMNASIEMRFSRGIFLTPPLLGYDNDHDGNLIINEEEAKTVQLAFFMYLYGHTCKQIAEVFTGLGRRTKKGNTLWSPNSILQILQNERHCGDVLARKTYTPNFLDHKSKKNTKKRNQHIRRNNHEAIVSRDDFIAVQRLISNAKYGNKGILPELNVIREGGLLGYVSVNPRWAAFTASDYRTASENVSHEGADQNSDYIEVEAHSGDFDLRGFEIARSQFFDTAKKICGTFSTENFWFSTECTRKLDNNMYVELLVHPGKQTLVIRPSSKGAKNAVKWMTIVDETYSPKSVGGTAFLKTLYEIFGWDIECRYRVRGVRRKKDDEVIIIFHMAEFEIFVSDETLGDYFSKNIRPLVKSSMKEVTAYPPSWADNFGSNYYRHEQALEMATINNCGFWNVAVEAQPYGNIQGLNVTNSDTVAASIEQIVDEFNQGRANIGDNS